jgi:hypothetical protein
MRGCMADVVRDVWLSVDAARGARLPVDMK